MGRKKSSTCLTCTFRSLGSSFSRRTLAKLRKSSSRSCSRWHSRCDQLDLLHRPAVARRLALAEVLGQELHVQADGRERVLDLVGQPAGQPGNLGVLIDQPLIDGVGDMAGDMVGSWILISDDGTR